MSHSSLAAMSRIRKRKRARGRAQVTVESGRVTGETIITAGMTPEREAEVRKQYYRDHEPTPAIVNADLTPEYLDKLRLDCLRAADNSMPGADPHAVVRAAAADLEVKLRFLRGQSWLAEAENYEEENYEELVSEAREIVDLFEKEHGRPPDSLAELDAPLPVNLVFRYIILGAIWAARARAEQKVKLPPLTTEELEAGLEQARVTLTMAELRGDKSPEWIANVKAVIAVLTSKLHGEPHPLRRARAQ